MSNNKPIYLSVITAKKPNRLSKHFTLKNGELKKSPGGQLAEGNVRVGHILNLSELGKLIESLTADQALCYGIPSISSAKIVTKDTLAEMVDKTGYISRTPDYFSWSNGPGILMLDYDPEDGQEALGRDELVAELRRAVPALGDTEMLWAPSASSYIINESTGQDHSGLRGQRLYIAVANASDIPRVGKAIETMLWASGNGYFKVSKSGTLLSRTLVDGCVWQENRLDFAAGASCEAPLIQKRGRPVLIEGKVKILDTLKAVPDPDQTIVKIADVRITEAKRSKEPQLFARSLPQPQLSVLTRQPSQAASLC